MYHSFGIVTFDSNVDIRTEQFAIFLSEEYLWTDYWNTEEQINFVLQKIFFLNQGVCI